jgi:hypothetical protein
MSKVKKSIKKQTAASIGSNITLKDLADDGGRGMIFADTEKPMRVSASRSVAKSRVNKWLQSENDSLYPNIRTLVDPISSNGGDSVDARDAIMLCQKAYRGFPLLRNIIDVMTELCNSRLFLKGGNKSTRDYIMGWWDTINIWQLREQFFREFFRSGNVFIYRLEGQFKRSDQLKLAQSFGSVRDDAKVPVKYMILDPKEIKIDSNVSLQEPIYQKILNSFELSRIIKPQTPDDKAIRDSLSPESLRALRDNVSSSMPLDPKSIVAVFYKKQPYEAFAVPFAFPVLRDIDAKLELKSIDMRVARQLERAFLLITAGAKIEDGGVSAATMQALQNLFANESLVRTLVADYTVKAEWLIPDVNKVLGTAKYEQLDKDIAAGLNAILFSQSEAFANTSIKVQVFIERLKEARQAFLTSFLIPEIKRLCIAINAKSCPEPLFEELNLKDELQYCKMFTTLAQFGLLTPKELFEAIDGGKLPNPEESLANQEEFLGQKERGFYAPLVMSGNSDNTDKGGRPQGSKAPQSTKEITPIGQSNASIGFGVKAFAENLEKLNDLHQTVATELRKTFKVRKFNDIQNRACKSLTEVIVANEPVENWHTSIANYIGSDKVAPDEFEKEVDSIIGEYGVDKLTAIALKLSKTTIPDGQ